MAQLPVPRRVRPVPGLSDGATLAVAGLHERARETLRGLIEAGHEAVLVGGCIRDLILRIRDPGASERDWDLATSAPPEVVSGLFPGSLWQNRFGTVTLPGHPRVEVTSYRTEASYRDRRRPDEVRFGTSLVDDLARRDFTINAVAWRPHDLDAGAGSLVDPFHGLADLDRGVVRAVGDPRERFAEDALRVLRGVRFSLRFGFSIEPATERALVDAAPTTATLSGERVRDELVRLLGDRAVRPSDAFAAWERLGLLRVLLPELAALRGVPQGKPIAGDALDHSLRAADALAPDDVVLRLAGLLHDIGKATTMADGHFIGHEVAGAEQAEAVMRRLRFGSRDVERVAMAIRGHMFNYEPRWSDAAIRRFMRRVGTGLDDLLALRAADNAASGVTEPTTGGADELRARIAAQQGAAIEPRQLAIDGHDLQRELGLEPGPQVGRTLATLLDAVIADPALNTRQELVRLARESARHEARAGGGTPRRGDRAHQTPPRARTAPPGHEG